MTPAELHHSMGRMEASLASLHEKIDTMVLPNCDKHGARLAKLEHLVTGVYGGVFILSAIGLLAKDVGIMWLKKKIEGGH